MSKVRICLSAVAFAGLIGVGTADAQTPRSPTVSQPAPTAGPSSLTTVEKWTNKRWSNAKSKWAKEKVKWADCQQQSTDQKLIGRKSWAFLYGCMT
jgi:hypothetical protein